MSGIGGVICWNGREAEEPEIAHMMEMIHHRGPDGLYWETTGNISLGYAQLSLQKQEELHRQPLWLPDKSCAIVADARIYNRSELLHRLHRVSWFQDEPSDAALILAAYERWQEGLLEFLDGDFAFAVWDRDRNLLFAARDPFAAKPFFYYWESEKFLFGSEPKQMLTLPGILIKPNDLLVGEYLFMKFEEIDKTFYEGIHRLKPAHYLLAKPSEITQHRWWMPDLDRQIYYSNHQDYFFHFRKLLEESVARRLKTDYPIGAHLSGGFDSSSVVAVAADLYQRDGGAFPRFETISAIYGNLPCDESTYIDSMVSRIPFPNHSFSPVDGPSLTNDLEEELWRTDSPVANIQHNFDRGCNQLLAEIGARTLLDGTGGDELTHEAFYLRDLARRRKYLLLVRESWLASRTSWNSFSWLLFDAIRAAVPKPVKGSYRWIRGRENWEPPTWATDEFSESYRQTPEAAGLQLSRSSSLIQETVLRDLSEPSLHWLLELLEVNASYNGYECRHPFCDRSLIEFVLAIPFEIRIPGGQWRYLQRRSLADILSPAILGRRRKAAFDSFVVREVAKAKDELEEILFSTMQWASAPYVQREQVQLLFQEFSTEVYETNSLLAMPLWRIAFLELWMRQLSRYSNCDIMSVDGSSSNANSLDRRLI